MARLPGIVLAAGLFSRVPMPAPSDFGPAEARRAILAFPALGAAIALVAGGVGAATHVVAPAGIAAVITLALMQALVGATHLDGLADAADGLAALGSMKSGRDRERVLEIMHQPDTGAMGVTAIGMVLLGQYAALSAASTWQHLWVIALVGAVCGRCSVVWATRRGIPCARHDGFGSLFAGTTTLVDAGLITLLVTVVALAGGWVLLGPWAIGLALTVLVTGAVAWGGTRLLHARLGGMTGDLYGALIEVTTTLAMMGAAITCSH